MALGSRERIGLERRLLVFGWPTEVGWGVGAAVLRFGSEKEVPRDFGRLGLAVSMDEMVQVMRGYGCVFYEDAAGMEELGQGL